MKMNLEGELIQMKLVSHLRLVLTQAKDNSEMAYFLT